MFSQPLKTDKNRLVAHTWKLGDLRRRRTDAQRSLLRFSSASAFCSASARFSARTSAGVKLCKA